LIAAEPGKERRVQRGVGREPPADVVLDAVMSANFGKQFSDEARDFADALDLMLPTQMRLVLRFLAGGSIWTVPLTFIDTRRRPVPPDRVAVFLGHDSCRRPREFIGAVLIRPGCGPSLAIAQPINDAPWPQTTPRRPFADHAPALDGAAPDVVSLCKFFFGEIDRVLGHAVPRCAIKRRKQS
jgi:hypothetical protein